MAAVKRSLNVGVVGLGPVGTGVAASIATKARSQVYLQLFSRSLERAVALSDRLGVDGANCAMRCHGGKQCVSASSLTSSSASAVASPYTSISKWSDVLLVCPPTGQPGATNVARDMLLDGTMDFKSGGAASSKQNLGLGGGLLHVSRPGQFIVCHGVLDPDTAIACRQVAMQRGSIFFDAPFLRNEVFLNATRIKSPLLKAQLQQKSGSVLHDYASFLSGQHTLLLSGGGGVQQEAVGGKSVDDDAALQRLRALLPWYADQQVYFGSTAGAASTAALWLDAMTAMHAAVAVEGLRLWDTLQQQRASALFPGEVDVDAASNREALWTALGHSDASSRLLQRRGRVMQHLLEDPTGNFLTSSSTSSSNSQDRFFQKRYKNANNKNNKPIGSVEEDGNLRAAMGGSIAVDGLQEHLGVLREQLWTSSVPPTSEVTAEEEEGSTFPLLTWATDSLAAAERCGWGDQDIAVLAQVPNEAIRNVEGASHEEMESGRRSSTDAVAHSDGKHVPQQQQQQQKVYHNGDDVEFY